MIITGKYPSLRLRRNRKKNWSRRLTQENSLSTNDLILPIFLVDGKNKKQTIKSMPGVYRYSVDNLSLILDRAIKNNIPMVALFPYTKPKLKDLFIIAFSKLFFNSKSMLNSSCVELLISLNFHSFFKWVRGPSIFVTKILSFSL